MRQKKNLSIEAEFSELRKMVQQIAAELCGVTYGLAQKELLSGAELQRYRTLYSSSASNPQIFYNGLCRLKKEVEKRLNREEPEDEGGTEDEFSK